jgi:hypothetical protein
VTDRTVHAYLSDGTEIVRYDRAGKWYAAGTHTTPRHGEAHTVTQPEPTNEPPFDSRRCPFAVGGRRCGCWWCVATRTLRKDAADAR